MAPKLTKVIRLDSMPLNRASFTKEGYLVDRPILTSIGIFEYHNPDGSVRRELRLPEDVFDPDSLKSYKGKPIIITHEAEKVDKNNIRKEQIGTILSEGYRSGDDVRAEIIIHDTDNMKRSGLKELSLGYELDLEETPGEWNGQHYDAIQHNVRVNHLALVKEARAGDQARLNIDGRDSEKILKGGKLMKSTKNTKTQHSDGVLTPEELAKAIEEYRARRAQTATATDEDDPISGVKKPEAEKEVPAVAKDGEDPVPEDATPEEKVQLIKEHAEARAADGEPEDIDGAKKVITNQDEDMKILFDIIDTLLAQSDFKDNTDGDEPAATPAVEKPEDNVLNDPKASEKATDGDEPDPAENKDNKPVEKSAEKAAAMNADSIDAIVRQRIQLGTIGRKINMDGLEDMGIMAAKKAIINSVRPGLRLDGKSESYINAAYDCAVEDINRKTERGVGYQKRQMFNKDSRTAENTGDSAFAARQRMIDRHMNMKEDK